MPLDRPSPATARAARWTLLLALLFCALPASAQQLSGFVDMHTHPMSNLGFGGMVLYGAPDTGTLMLATQKYRGFDLFNPECNTSNELAGNLGDALGNCNAMHGAPGLDNDCGDLIRSAIIDKVEEKYVYEYDNPGAGGQIKDHDHAGYPSFAHWPHWSTVTHQQMYWEWIRRAYDGGQRVLVALAVNNALLAKAGNASQYIDDKSSVELQLAQITSFVGRHSDFMEIARSSADLRRIVSANRLAVVLGVETDDFGNLTRRARILGETVTQATVNAEIQRLYDLGVRYILPIHFSNSILGGYAINKDLFALNSKEYTNAYPVVRETCGEGIQFRLDRTDFSGIEADLLRTRDLGRIIDGQPTYPAPAAGCGHANSLPLSTLGYGALSAMMNLGMMIDIDHMSRLTADNALDFAATRDYPLNSGHNGPQASECSYPVSGDPDRCNENARTRPQYEKIRTLRGMVGLGHGGQATNFVRNYRSVLDIMGNRPVAIGTDANGLEALPAPDPSAPVTYNSSFPLYSFAGRPFDINVVGFAHYGLFPDYIRSWQASSNSATRMTDQELQSFMSSAEQFARMWERSALRAVGAPRTASLSTSTAWCTHAGATVLRGDFNGDGAEDFLCRDPGRLWIDYADNRGVITGTTDWYLDTTWCTQSGTQLFLGDFNGDGRTDLLCRDPSRVSLDYADTAGRFATTDWSLATNWCTHAGAQVQLGDFNGDGRMDLMCRDPQRLWFDYADASGRFGGTDWYLDTTWCTETGATLSLADVSGDGRTDLICREPTRLRVDYANTSGQFSTTDWTSSTTFCTHSGATTRFADANGDGRADWICHDPYRIWVDYADSSSRFLGLDWYVDTTFCASSGDQLELMDMNGDNRDDFVCKGRTALNVRYSQLGGTY